jgi:hypothetical protein
MAIKRRASNRQEILEAIERYVIDPIGTQIDGEFKYFK